MMLLTCIVASAEPMADITSSGDFCSANCATRSSCPLTFADAYSIQCALSLRSSCELFFSQIVRLSIFPLCSPAKHFSHTPPVDPLQTQQTIFSIDHFKLRHDDTSLQTPEKRAGFGLNARPSQGGVECGMAVALGEAMLEQDGRVGG